MMVQVEYDIVNGLYAYTTDGDPIKIPYNDSKVNKLADKFVRLCKENKSEDKIMATGSKLEQAIEKYYN